MLCCQPSSSHLQGRSLSQSLTSIVDLRCRSPPSPPSTEPFYVALVMSSSQPTRVVRGGLKLKGGLVVRAAPPSTVPRTIAATAATAKRKQHPDAEEDSRTAISSQPIKPESPATTNPPAPSSPSSAPHSLPAIGALPSDAPVYVKRTRRADEVEEVNEQLQQLAKATEHKDRRQLIAEDRQRVAAQLTGTEEREVDGLRLVEVGRGYVKHGFGDESATTATRRLNEREKKKSDRYCK